MLPIVPSTPRKKAVFMQPVQDPKLPGIETLDPTNPSGYGEISRVEKDTAKKTTRVTAINSSGTKYPWGIERQEENYSHETNDERPENTSFTGKFSYTVELKDRTLIWEADALFRSDHILY